MKTNLKQKIKCCFTCICLSAFAFTGCKKLAGLELQTDTDHIVSTLDPHINKSALQFLKDRSLGTGPDDTIFIRMYQGVLYSGIDTAEYSKPGRTFIFMHNDAVYRLSSNKVTTDCFFG
ncbi:MAG: hypothetical protein ABI594_20315, partial [Ginsengibacter sp.]